MLQSDHYANSLLTASWFSFLSYASTFSLASLEMIAGILFCSESNAHILGMVEILLEATTAL